MGGIASDTLVHQGLSRAVRLFAEGSAPRKCRNGAPTLRPATAQLPRRPHVVPHAIAVPPSLVFGLVPSLKLTLVTVAVHFGSGKRQPGPSAPTRPGNTAGGARHCAMRDAQVGFRSLQEAGARLDWLQRRSCPAYKDRVELRILELEQRELDRRMQRAF